MLRLVKIGVEGEGPCTDLMEVHRPDDVSDIADLGLTLSEAKRLLARVQQEIVAGQARDRALRRPDCSRCGNVCCVKDYRDHVVATLCGQVTMRAWFRIRPFWVTQGVRKPPAAGDRISVGRVFCAGGGKPPPVKLAGAEAVPGRAGSASADDLDPSSARVGFCPGARHAGCAGSGGGSGKSAADPGTRHRGVGAG